MQDHAGAVTKSEGASRDQRSFVGTVHVARPSTRCRTRSAAAATRGEWVTRQCCAVCGLK